MSRHTYEMGVIGNCAFMAYIHKNSNVEWMCWPRFDSSFVFGGLLDKEKGGCFTIQPASENWTSEQFYEENTNILITVFHCGEGIYRLYDYAPRFHQYDRYYKPLMVMRRLEVVAGSPAIVVRCKPVGEYGLTKPKIAKGSNHIRYMGISDYDNQLRLTTNIPLEYVLEERSFLVSNTKYFALTYGPPLESELPATAENFYQRTKHYWMNWVKTTSIANFHQKYIIRSSLILKLHQFEDTGGIIASGSTSLPEYPGSGRNWDYRYCWMRDSYYTLNAFNNIGHFEELERYFYYMRNIIYREQDRAQPLYNIVGERDITEHILEHLTGYLDNNTPVRIGNQAHTQRQNDVYGQILVSLLPLYVDGRLIQSDKGNYDNIISWLLDKIEETMDEEDAGLWEFRHFAQKHTYTFLFHWAGSKAAIKIAQYKGEPKLEKRAKKLADRSALQLERCYDQKRKCYTQAIGKYHMDASTLKLITMNYLPHDSQAARDHLAALEKELKTETGLFYRYKRQDDFGKPESTFFVCAFWYVEALACVGRLDEAIEVFEKLLTYSNHLMLFSEDVDEKDGSQWGNFPQTYSHVGLMNAAYRIAKKLDKPIFL